MARGWCRKHYYRWVRRGDPLLVDPQQWDIRRRTLAKFTVGDGCWLWTAGKTSDGYGTMRADGRGVLAHRFMYEWLVGPIPEGLELDHLCRVRHCVRPDHLEPVTHAENMRRGYWSMVTHCPSGHPYTDENTRIYQGHRYCRACKRVG